MKRLIRTSLMAGLLVASSAALAQNVYVGGSVGQARHDVDCTGLTCDRTDNGFKLFGGYMFTPNIGVEAHYVHLGETTVSGVLPPLGAINGALKATGFGASVVGVLPLDAFSIFGKIGATYMDTKISGTFAGFSVSDSDKTTSANFGLGASYNFTRELAARLEWERFRAEYAGEKEDIDLISIGVTFRF